MLGVWQLVLIFAIILVLFGAGKIPQIMKDLGSGIKAFKKGFEGDEAEIDVEREIEKSGNSLGQKIRKQKLLSNKEKKNIQVKKTTIKKNTKKETKTRGNKKEVKQKENKKNSRSSKK